MTAKIIDGKAVAERIRGEIAEGVVQMKAAHGVVPGLATVLVGDNPASHSYVRMKRKACADAGIESLPHELPGNASQEEVEALVRRLNDDPRVHGILVQLPLPRHLDEERVLSLISLHKDVDGFHPVNVGKMLIGEPGFLPCTPHGIQEMLVRSGNDPEGKHVVVVGRSNIVGKPVAAILMQKRKGANATVTVAHSRTKDLASITRMADIVVAAIGSREFIKADMVKDGVVVIDVGSNRIDDPSTKKGYRWVGDVAFEEVKEKASAITPVPGGVGPMTIVMLMKNTVISACRACGLEY